MTRVSFFPHVVDSIRLRKSIATTLHFITNLLFHSAILIMATEIGALSHLVEAATALAKLDCNAALKVEGSKTASMVGGDHKASFSSNLESSPRGKREIFPQRLMAVLNDVSLSDVVSWLPHGKSFVIIRPDVFTEKVMPAYFPPVDARGSTKYPSFTRKLNRWYVQTSFAYRYEASKRHLSYGFVC